MAKHDKEKDPPNFTDPDEFTTHDKVDRIFKDHPRDYISKLEEMGFVYQDDDEYAQEEEEEAIAKPLNTNQVYLVTYFNGDIPLSDKTLEIYLEERRSPNPNYPLFRKYYKSGNKHLLAMILHGLHQYPTLDELLTDLAYFHEFHNILTVLIQHYTIACEKQENLETFSDLVMDFYYATAPDGYDALYALKEKFRVGTDKRKVIDFLNEIEDAGVDEVEF